MLEQSTALKLNIQRNLCVRCSHESPMIVSAFEIVNSVDFLQAITWTSDAWKEVTTDTIKNCFAKCGIAEKRVEVNDELDDEFVDLFKELTGELESNMIAEEFINFDAATNTMP